jgi:deoxyribodipyrimidine photo-lyase
MNLIWFRNDLRIIDNPALCHAMNEGQCQAIYISTPQQWQQHDMAPIQADLIERHLNVLSEQLSTLGISLIHIESSDFSQQINVLNHYCSQHNIGTVFANSEIELNERQRDQQLLDSGLPLTLFEADVIINKGSVLNGQQTMYKVFTPFRNAWLKRLKSHFFTLSPVPEKQKSHEITNTNITLNYPKKNSEKWPLAHAILDQVFPRFIHEKHDNYQQARDFPGQKGTSGLSPYLAIGAISAKTLVNQLLQSYPHLLDDSSHPHFCWLNELAWRDFYKHLIFHHPELCKHQNFQKKYDALQWPSNPAYFDAWCQGKTGYPLVDAAMRQLLTTGWMHNRLRMVVASFLTKHLLVDWRLGEKFFMQHLIDGDFSANNGGWQWAASTGCDAQPYFRIFNPIRQSERFDPNGDFIRKYLPELENVPNKQIHFPHAYLQKNQQDNVYWPAIVEHKGARENALAFYK